MQFRGHRCRIFVAVWRGYLPGTTAYAAECPPALAKGRIAESTGTPVARALAGLPWLNDWGLVFTMPLGEPINPSTLLWDFGIRLNGARLPPMRLHDLRHSYATLLHEAGVDWKEISHLMGHSKVSITQDLYAHMTPLLRQRTAEAMDQMFSRSSASPSPIA